MTLSRVYKVHNMHKKYMYTSTGRCANYSHSSLHVPSKKASRRKRMWSTQEGSNLLLLASKISPAAEKRRSTAVEVAGAVKYLDISYIVGIVTIHCGYQDKPKPHLLANATRAMPAGPLVTKEGSIFCHQARHSTS